MKEITKEMSKQFKLYKLGYDFAGYTFTNKNQLSAHHLIIPARNGGKLTRDNTDKGKEMSSVEGTVQESTVSE